MQAKGKTTKGKKVVKGATVGKFSLPVSGRLAKILASAKADANYRGNLENFAIRCLTTGIKQATT
jgi:hypothetical protein